MSFLRKSTVPTLVRQSQLAAVLPSAELRQLDHFGTIVDVDEGREIIAEASLGRECFVIVDGEFVVAGPGVQAAVGAGDVAGELALLTGQRRSASVVSATDSVVYALPPQAFATLLSEAPQFRSRVVQTASQRLGTRDLSLPAQYVRRGMTPCQPSDTWTARLAAAPRWRSLT